MGSLAFGGGYFGEYADGGVVGVTLVLLAAVCTGHIGYGWTGGVEQEDNGCAESLGVEASGQIGYGANGGVALVGSGVAEEDDEE